MKRYIGLIGMALALASCGTQTLMPAAPMAAVTAASRPRPGADQPGLMHHVQFFDEDGDGMITLAESRHGLERLGIGTIESTALSLVLNPILGKEASGSLTTTVSIAGLFKNFKPTTTGIFGPGGRFDATRFETLFTKNDRNQDGALDSDEIDAMLSHDLIDPSVRTRTKVGFGLLLKVAGDRQVGSLQAISKNRLKSFYDGNLFYDIAAKNGN